MENLFAGELATELVKQLVSVSRKAYLCKATAEQLRHSVESLFPVIQEIRYSGVELPQHRQSQLSELAEQLKMGLELAKKASASSRWNLYRSLQLSRRMDRVDRWVGRWLERQMTAHVLADVHHLRVESSVSADRLWRIEQRIGGVEEREVTTMGMVMAGMEGLGLGKEQGAVDCGGGGDEWIGVGMRVGKEKVKEMVVGGGGDVVGICGLPGSGKTTLAREIYRDPDLRRHFNDRIFLETVSQSPDQSLKSKLREQITGGPEYDPYPKWQGWEQPISSSNIGGEPTLVVLDDVWAQSDLEELLFVLKRIPKCKTVVVSRFKFPAAVVDGGVYEVGLLGEEEALSLFCRAAFRQESLPSTADKKLVNQIVAECKGLPLALKVIGASLRDQPPKIWASAKNKLSRGESISESHEAQLLDRLATSIECLKSKARECFLDLGSFPEDKKIPLDVLINMWMEIHDLDEEDAYAVLVELSNKSLLNLVKDTQNRAGDIYSSYSELSITQHDVLRDLALHMSNHETVNKRQRLVMAKREDGLPRDWERGKNQEFEAQIVSIHTGEMEESDWFHMYFPKAEVLILNFSSSNYFLPPFLKSMSNLKALVLINYGSSNTVLHNLSMFTSLENLRSIWFEKVTVPPLPTTTVPLKNLKKIFLVLCELGHDNLGEFLVDLPQTFPRLSHLTIDHCVDLAGLPPSICEMSSTLQSISISNCHYLSELPTELGRLSSLRILRVYACPMLKKLPRTINQLKSLKYLDISQCINLRCLPNDLDQMTSLEKIDMRGCPMIRNIPVSLSLKSLGHVVCDEDVAFLWREAERCIPELRVQVAEECYNLDWLVE